MGHQKINNSMDCETWSTDLDQQGTLILHVCLFLFRAMLRMLSTTKKQKHSRI